MPTETFWGLAGIALLMLAILAGVALIGKFDK